MSFFFWHTLYIQLIFIQNSTELRLISIVIKSNQAQVIVTSLFVRFVILFLFVQRIVSTQFSMVFSLN